MTDKEKTIKELKEALDGLDITNKYRLNLIRAIEYLQEEPVSEELEEAAHKYADIRMSNYETAFYAFMSGARWQKAKDQETIETAIHHAYHNGRLEMKEKMMEKGVETTFNVSLPSGLYDKLWIKGCKDGDKLLVIKKDEL